MTDLEKGKKELKVLKQMMFNWKKGYLSWISPGGNNEYIVKEFQEEIQIQAYPYIERLLTTKHITNKDASEFFEHCKNQMSDLEDKIKKYEKEEEDAIYIKETSWITRLYHKLKKRVNWCNVWQKEE